MTTLTTTARIKMIMPTRIALRRTVAGLSRKELAERIGATFNSICIWEKGETIPCAERLYELADALACSTDYLLGRTEL